MAGVLNGAGVREIIQNAKANGTLNEPLARPVGSPNLLAPVMINNKPMLFAVDDPQTGKPVPAVMVHDGQGGFAAMTFREARQMLKHEVSGRILSSETLTGSEENSRLTAARDAYVKPFDALAANLMERRIVPSALQRVEPAAFPFREYQEPEGRAPSPYRGERDPALVQQRAERRAENAKDGRYTPSRGSRTDAVDSSAEGEGTKTRAERRQEAR